MSNPATFTVKPRTKLLPVTGRTIYTIEVVTKADRLTVEGEGDVLTFIARHHFNRVEGVCDAPQGD